MKTIKVYSPEELKDISPDGYDRALQHWRESIDDVPWQDEIMDSLKGIFKASGITLVNWSIGAYDRSHVEFQMGEVGEFTGPRAAAWLESHLFGPLRIPWSGPRRWEVAKYGSYYRPGMVPPCPFTGVCYDEDFIDVIRWDIGHGMTLANAYHDLAQRASRLFEEALEDAQSEESFISQDYLEFTEEGRQV